VRLSLLDKIFREKSDAVNLVFRRQARSLVVSCFYCRTSRQASSSSDIAKGSRAEGTRDAHLTGLGFSIWLSPNRLGDCYISTRFSELTEFEENCC
jgi:hypothetical protein